MTSAPSLVSCEMEMKISTQGPVRIHWVEVLDMLAVRQESLSLLKILPSGWGDVSASLFLKCAKKPHSGDLVRGQDTGEKLGYR